MYPTVGHLSYFPIFHYYKNALEPIIFGTVVTTSLELISRDWISGSKDVHILKYFYIYIAKDPPERLILPLEKKEYYMFPRPVNFFFFYLVSGK